MKLAKKIIHEKLALTKQACIVSILVAMFSLLLLVPSESAQSNRSAGSRGKGFATPQEAVESLIEGAATYDEKRLMEILGPNSWDIVHTGEPARDRENAMAFAEQARTKMHVDIDPRTRTRATLIVGNDDWPFPLPLTKVGNAWYFDANAGRQELLLRRIGRNELDAIEICRNYVDVQHEYALMKKTDGVNQYAQRIVSTDGQQDALAWKNADGTWGGPLGEEAAAALSKGYHAGQPYHGYFFKVLKGQGPGAPLGELDYVIKGVMIGGFALIAAPAQYRNTGVKTFMVSQDGVVYEKDLGLKTLEIFQSIDRFNPDQTWKPILQKDK